MRSLKVWEDKGRKDRSCKANLCNDLIFFNEENCCDDDRKKLRSLKHCFKYASTDNGCRGKVRFLVENEWVRFIKGLDEKGPTVHESIALGSRRESLIELTHPIRRLVWNQEAKIMILNSTVICE